MWSDGTMTGLETVIWRRQVFKSEASVLAEVAICHLVHHASLALALRHCPLTAASPQTCGRACPKRASHCKDRGVTVPQSVKTFAMLKVHFSKRSSLASFSAFLTNDYKGISM